jgi:hypothetical protein
MRRSANTGQPGTHNQNIYSRLSLRHMPLHFMLKILLTSLQIATGFRVEANAATAVLNIKEIRVHEQRN